MRDGEAHLLLACCLWLLTPSLMSAAAEGNIVVLGDSLTAGFGVGRDKAYPALLQEKIRKAGLPWRVINAGVSGDTTGDGLRRVGESVNASTRILIVALGANDGLRRQPVAQSARNLSAIVERARQRSPGLLVVIAGMRMPAEWTGADYSRAFSEMFAEVARAHDAILLPYLLDRVGGVAALNQSDAIHPTVEGQREIAITVWKILEPLLKPITKPR